ncbi:hypothetical protein JCM8547_000618, partial [Rhodosporidiobolus lusitaniae]
LAAEFNLSETAFARKLKGEQAGTEEEPVYELRWRTPTVEVNLCGQATLATAHVQAQRPCPILSCFCFSSFPARSSCFSYPGLRFLFAPSSAASMPDLPPTLERFLSHPHSFTLRRHSPTQLAPLPVFPTGPPGAGEGEVSDVMEELTEGQREEIVRDNWPLLLPFHTSLLPSFLSLLHSLANHNHPLPSDTQLFRAFLLAVLTAAGVCTPAQLERAAPEEGSFHAGSPAWGALKRCFEKHFHPSLLLWSFLFDQDILGRFGAAQEWQHYLREDSKELGKDEEGREEAHEELLMKGCQSLVTLRGREGWRTNYVDYREEARKEREHRLHPRSRHASRS